MNNPEKYDDLSLLRKFNNRDYVAYSVIYKLFYKDLYYYSNSLYRETTESPEDIIQDIFLEIWEKTHVKFDSIKGIKGYIFIAIKRKFLMYCRHKKVSDKATERLLQDDGYYVLQAAESEIFSTLPDLLNLLPEECARTFKLFMEGFNAKEIAEILQKKQSTVYNQRNEAIFILRRKLSKSKNLYIFVLVKIIHF